MTFLIEFRRLDIPDGRGLTGLRFWKYRLEFIQKLHTFSGLYLASHHAD
jgi:hypothetical protein